MEAALHTTAIRSRYRPRTSEHTQYKATVLAFNLIEHTY